jgi:hypothetical protein
MQRRFDFRGIKTFFFRGSNLISPLVSLIFLAQTTGKQFQHVGGTVVSLSQFFLFFFLKKLPFDALD